MAYPRTAGAPAIPLDDLVLSDDEGIGRPIDPENVRRLLELMVTLDGTSVHLKVPGRPQMRIGEDLVPVGLERLKPGDPDRAGRCLREMAEVTSGKLVFSLGLEGVGRFRVHAYRQRGSRGLVIHRILTAIPPLSMLGATPAFAEFTGPGLVLVSGSARVELMAALIDARNWSDSGHVVTVERHMRYLHADQLVSISQLEVGVDVRSLIEGLRTAAKLDPDWIVLSEATDADCALAALALAEERDCVVLVGVTAGAVEESVDTLAGLFGDKERRDIKRRMAAALVAAVHLETDGTPTRLERASLVRLANAWPMTVGGPTDAP